MKAGYGEQIREMLSEAENERMHLMFFIEIAKPNIEQLQQVFLYAKDTADIIQRLDVIDPRQGKIAGPAEQELSFKTWYDPATYSSSSDTSDVIVDVQSNWTDRYVGKLWWNLKEASWYNPYQGNSQYRTNTFNKLLPTALYVVLKLF